MSVKKSKSTRSSVRSAAVDKDLPPKEELDGESQVSLKPRRPVSFKIARQDVFANGKQLAQVVVTRMFDTSASDEELKSWLDDQIQRLEELRKLLRNNPVTSDVKRFAIYIRDLDEDVVCRPLYTAGEATLEELRREMAKAFKGRAELYKALIYEKMVQCMDRKSWLFADVTKEQWREVCATVHPLFMSDEYTEMDRKKFASTSLESIKSGLRRGVYKSKNFRKQRTRGVASRKRADKSAGIRKVVKKTEKRH